MELCYSNAHTQQCLLSLKRNFPISPPPPLSLSLSLSLSHTHTGIELPYQSHIPTLCFVCHLQEHGSLSQAIFV